jgi:hypothetical protein
VNAEASAVLAPCIDSGGIAVRTVRCLRDPTNSDAPVPIRIFLVEGPNFAKELREGKLTALAGALSVDTEGSLSLNSMPALGAASGCSAVLATLPWDMPRDTLEATTVKV